MKKKTNKKFITFMLLALVMSLSFMNLFASSGNPIEDYTYTGIIHSVVNQSENMMDIVKKDNMWHLLSYSPRKVFLYDSNWLYLNISHAITGIETPGYSTHTTAFAYDEINKLWYVAENNLNRIYQFDENFTYTGFNIPSRNRVITDIVFKGDYAYTVGQLGDEFNIYYRNMTFTGIEIDPFAQTGITGIKNIFSLNYLNGMWYGWYGLKAPNTSVGIIEYDGNFTFTGKILPRLDVDNYFGFNPMLYIENETKMLLLNKGTIKEYQINSNNTQTKTSSKTDSSLSTPQTYFTKSFFNTYNLFPSKFQQSIFFKIIK